MPCRRPQRWRLRGRGQRCGHSSDPGAGSVVRDDVDPRVRAFDASFAATGHRACGFINARVFAAMKPDAVLINVARGEEVDEDALVEAVTAGRIRGAVLDVYDGELAGRPPRPELAGLPQILLTPHISSRR